MRKGDVQLGQPYQEYTDTKANIEALAGLTEGCIAYATDTNEFGSYDGAAWTWGQGGSGLPVADTQTIIKGSADATKLLRFEVDGFTTGTTRVITPSDANITLAGQDYANTFSVTQKVYTSAAAETVAISLYPATSGGLPAYGIGMANTSAEGIVSYRSGTGDIDAFGHRFFVNNVEKLLIGGARSTFLEPVTITSTSTTAFKIGTTFIVDTSGFFIGVGGTPVNQFDVITSGGAGSATRGINVSQHNDGVQAAQILFTKSRGTKTSPTVLSDGDLIGLFNFKAYGTSGYSNDQSLFGASVTGSQVGGFQPTSIFFITGVSEANYTPNLLVHSNGYVGIGPIGGTIITSLTATSNRLHLVDTTTTTNAVLTVSRIEAQVSTASTGGANGFGVGQSFFAETATDGTNQQQGLISTSWIDATNATRKAKLSLSAYDTAARLGMEIEASGTAAKLSFYGGTTVVRGAALTTQLTSITHTSPGTPDYAIQDLIDSSAAAAFGFATKDEGNTVLSVIRNLQIRVAELEARLGSATGVNLFA